MWWNDRLAGLLTAPPFEPANRPDCVVKAVVTDLADAVLPNRNSEARGGALLVDVLDAGAIAPTGAVRAPLFSSIDLAQSIQDVAT